MQYCQACAREYAEGDLTKKAPPRQLNPETNCKNIYTVNNLWGNKMTAEMDGTVFWQISDCLIMVQTGPSLTIDQTSNQRQEVQ